MEGSHWKEMGVEHYRGQASRSGITRSHTGPDSDRTRVLQLRAAP